MTRSTFPIAILCTAIMNCQGQVLVSQEPRHHNVFENTWARVLDVRIPPGDTSLFHKHATPSVFIVLTSTKTGSEVIVEPEGIPRTPGNVWFEGFYTKPRIHRVWNSDTSEFHVIDMELPNPNPISIDPPLTIKSFTQLFDEKPVRGYRVILDPNTTIRIPRRKAPILIVGLDDATGNIKANDRSFVKKGDFSFIPAGNAIEIVNKGATKESLAFLELK